LEGEDSSVLEEGDSPSQRGDNSERVKIHNFSRTRRPKSIKLGTNYPLVKRIKVYSNKEPGPVQRGDNNINVRK
jgi:hypothetical protein